MTCFCRRGTTSQPSRVPSESFQLLGWNRLTSITISECMWFLRSDPSQFQGFDSSLKPTPRLKHATPYEAPRETLDDSRSFSTIQGAATVSSCIMSIHDDEFWCLRLHRDQRYTVIYTPFMHLSRHHIGFPLYATIPPTPPLRRTDCKLMVANYMQRWYQCKSRKTLLTINARYSEFVPA